MDTEEKTKERHEQLLADHIVEMRDAFWGMASTCESPIEVAMLVELQWMNLEYGNNAPRYIREALGADHLDSVWRAMDTSDVVIMPQAGWQNYRIDLAIFASGMNGGRLKIAIECDGHAFHEKTKQQAARDKSRDRDLTVGGWVPFHFTGHEIYKDAKGFAAQVAQYVDTWLFGEIQGYYDARMK